MGDDQQNCSVPWLLAVITINNNNNIPAPSRAIITRGFNITCDVRLYLISNALQWVQQWLAARGRSLQLLLLQYTHQQSSPSSLQQEKCDWGHMSILRTGEQNPARSGGSEDRQGERKSGQEMWLAAPAWHRESHNQQTFLQLPALQNIFTDPMESQLYANVVLFLFSIFGLACP